VPHHPGDLPEGTLRAILKHAGISVDEFLNFRT
jgi:predicted RNA binding protein YcfA (HicA-like mRNA interferase family)